MNAPSSPLIDPASGIPASDRELVARLTQAEAELISGLPSDAPNDPKRRKRVGHTAEEIEDQPLCISRTLAQNDAVMPRVAAALAARAPKRSVLTGCGDSLACHIGLRSLWEQATGLPCLPVQALELAYFPGALIDAQTIVLGLSSSGSTPRTVEAMLTARQRGAATVALTNTEGSAMTDVADHTLMISAVRRGWPTQASTAAMAAEAQLAAALGQGLGRPDLPAELGTGRLAGHVAQALAATKEPARIIGRRLSGTPLLHLCGAGPGYAAAKFGAAKVKECASGHAIAHRLEEVHHYTSTTRGETMVVIAPTGPSRARAADTLRQVRAWGGRSIAVLSNGDTALGDLADDAIFLPQVPEELAALTFTIPLQYLALHMALAEFDGADNA